MEPLTSGSCSKLKLAEAEWMCQRTGEWPILLLDEVLAELDTERRAFLLAHVNGAEQTLITTTDPALFDADFLADMKLFKVAGGRIIEEDARESDDGDPPAA